MKDSLIASGRRNFLAGLAVVLPAAISIGLIVWVCGTVSNVTDALLIFLPRKLTHSNLGQGPMYWYWSLAAFMVAIVLISVVGRMARNYFGRRMIEWVEKVMLRIPFLNKIYSATKQVNDAFASGDKNAFKTVVLVEFPREGSRTIGFITSDQHAEVQHRTKEKMVCVFVPTTPNPSSGFLIFLPEDKVVKLEMSVADGIKYVISLGAIPPAFTPPKSG